MAYDNGDINVLATELMSKIFIYTLDLDAAQRDGGETQELCRYTPLSQLSVPLVVSTVCHRWRIIAENTQPLWQGISIPRIPSKAKQQRLSFLLKVWLARSGNSCPLYFMLGGEDPREDIDEDMSSGASYASDSNIPCAIAGGLQEVLLKYMPRCSHLVLRFGGSNYGIHNWTKRLDLHSIQNLKYLGFHQFVGMVTEGPAPIFRYAPKLQNVHFRSRSLSGGVNFYLPVELPALPYDQLLAFVWNGLASVTQALSVFKSAQRMQTLGLYAVNAQNMRDSLDVPSRIVCPKLLYLHLCSECLPYAHALTFPGIQKMSLVGKRLFEPVFCASGGTLRFLRLVNVEVSTSDFHRAACQRFPLLVLLEVHSRDSSNVEELLKALLPDANGQFVLPHLRRLILSCPDLNCRNLACIARWRSSLLGHRCPKITQDPLPSDEHELLEVKRLEMEGLYVHDKNFFL